MGTEPSQRAGREVSGTASDGVDPDRVLGDVGTRLLFENDRVRVWRMKLAPGESSAVHRHDSDYLLVKVAGDTIAVDPEPDTVSEYTEYAEYPVKAGHVDYLPRGGVERAHNPGDEEYHEVIIELKD